MKITHKDDSVKVRVGSIQTGTCFIDSGGIVCMMIDEFVTNKKKHLNAVILITGELIYIEHDTYVKIVNTELIVEG